MTMTRNPININIVFNSCYTVLRIISKWTRKNNVNKLNLLATQTIKFKIMWITLWYELNAAIDFRINGFYVRIVMTSMSDMLSTMVNEYIWLLSVFDDWFMLETSVFFVGILMLSIWSFPRTTEWTNDTVRDSEGSMFFAQ